jgi:hypothetical protein
LRDIGSASVDKLTSPGLFDLRDMISSAREQKKQVDADLSEAVAEAKRLVLEREKRQRSIFRWFYRKRIAAIGEQLPVVIAEGERLAAWQQATAIAVDFATGEMASRAWCLSNASATSPEWRRNGM